MEVTYSDIKRVRNNKIMGLNNIK